MSMRSGTSRIQEEMREVEEELEEDSSRHDTQNARGSNIPLEALEEGKIDLGMGMGMGMGMGGYGESSGNARGSFSSGSRGASGPGGRDGSPVSPRRFSSSSPASPRGARHGPSIHFPLSQSHSQSSSSSTMPLSGTPGHGYGKKGSRSWIGGIKEGARNAIQLMTNPVFAQAFVLTFLGEWGDRSQITTIAMGGAHVSDLAFMPTCLWPVSLPSRSFRRFYQSVFVWSAS